MRIRQLKIERFRGIRELQWDVAGCFVCLIGPGDSCKSTILDAIELVNSPRWNPIFDDTDFYNLDTTQPIVIEATVGDLPDPLVAERKFGHHLRGWSDQGLHDEPQPGDEAVLTIRLSVDASLQPQWLVVTDRTPDGVSIFHKDRESFGLSRLGVNAARHLGWSQGSVLARLTDLQAIPAPLAAASRVARQTVNLAGLTQLYAAAGKAQSLAAHLGVSPNAQFAPCLDVQSMALKQGSLSIHDGDVPLRRAGLGTQRLVAFSLQREAGNSGGPILVDEIEHGLEPHRIRRVLHALRFVPPAPAGQPQLLAPQVFLTSHSPDVIRALSSPDLHLIRNNDGVVQITQSPSELQEILRGQSDAFLGSKVLVCEGRTELGFCRQLDRWWATSDPRRAFAYLGVVPVNGGGSNAPTVATKFREFNFPVAFLVDSDVALQPTPAVLGALGIEVIEWDGRVAIEGRIALDLPWAGVLHLLQLAIDDREGDGLGIAQSVRSKYPVALPPLDDDPLQWTESPELRQAVGVAAKTSRWFKTIESGEQLALIVSQHLAAIPTTDLALKLQQLRSWVDRDA
ncbi:ATP-dependent endonuclease [Planctomycetota bacterium]